MKTNLNGSGKERRPALSARFTIIELMVVVAILMILVSIFMPALKTAREMAKKVVCIANLKQVGVAGQVFIDDHRGFLPGRAYRETPTGSSLTWHDIITQEGRIKLQRMGEVQATGWLYCPAMQPDGADYSRAYVANINACGGANWGSNPPEGPYGLALEPGDFPGEFPPVGSGNPYEYSRYSYGAKLNKFSRPAYQIWVRENERAADEGSGQDTPLVLGGGGGYPLKWNTSGGSFAFRHPGFTANHLFFDMHVENLSYKTDCAKTARYNLQ